MSDIIFEFVDPFLKDCKTNDELKRTIEIAIAIWNYSNLPK
jgi:hypothetical protein